MPTAYRIEHYNSSHKEQWDACVAASKNGTFLHYRDFMEYHADRFEDYSLVIFENEKIVAVMPGNKVDDTVYSHQGLTYGGLVYGAKVRVAGIINILGEILKLLYNDGILRLYVKCIPHIYHRQPAQEAEYALFTAGAKLSRRDSLSVYDYSAKPEFSNLRHRGIKKGGSNNMHIVEEHNFKDFWVQVLIPNLSERHKANPVHTYAEIENLARKFPENIKQFNVYHNDKIVAGATMFVTDTVAHAQYISGIAEINPLGGLDYLFNHLLEYFSDKKYFDFGSSNENGGMSLNEGLANWKEGFGARAVIQDFYEVKTENFVTLDNVLV